MLPALLTVMIIVWVLQFVYNYIGFYVDRFAQWIVVQWLSLSAGHGFNPHFHNVPDVIDEWDRVDAAWAQWHLWIIGFALAFVLIYIFGRFIASIIGRGMWRMIEHGFFRLPIIKQIYPSVKQVTDFLLAERKMKFSRVVAVEYPRKGIWSLGLATNEGMRTLREATGHDLVTVFIPSSPTPVTGYTITVRREEVIDLPLSIDDALRLTVSGGVIMPLGQIVQGPESDSPVRGLVPMEPKKRKEISA